MISYEMYAVQTNMAPSSPTDTTCLSSRLKVSEVIELECPLQEHIFSRDTAVLGSSLRRHRQSFPAEPPVTMLPPSFELTDNIARTMHCIMKRRQIL